MTISKPVSLCFAIALSLFFCFWKLDVIKERDKNDPFPISWDVYGYYLYLPATLIYSDPGLEDNSWLDSTFQKYKPSPMLYQLGHGHYGRKIIIYNIGYSLLYLPGFLIAHSVAEPLGFAADGFSKPYQISLQITALIFSFLGIFMFRRICLYFFSDRITLLIMVCCLLGTNYLYQAAYDGTMPHNFIFTINCFLIWYSIKWHETREKKFAVAIAVVLALGTICRPVELLWGLFPLLWGVTSVHSLKERMSFFRTYKSHLKAFTLAFLSVASVQLVYWVYSSGHLISLNLHSEKLSFTDPYTLKFLFSYRKGWLLYTPIMAIGLLSILLVRKRVPAAFIPVVVVIILHIYVASSWENWWYAASFSQRPMVEAYPIMLFSFGSLLQWLKGKQVLIRLGSALIMLMLILLNLFQTYQFVDYIIDPERMTKEYYWRVFANTKITGEDRELLSIDRNQSTITDESTFAKKYLRKSKLTFLTGPPECKFGKGLITAESAFIVVDTFFTSLTSKSHVWIRVEAKVRADDSVTLSKAYMAGALISKDRVISYQTSIISPSQLKSQQWNMMKFDYLPPEIRHNDDKIRIIIWSNTTSQACIKDVTVEIYEPKNDYR